MPGPHGTKRRPGRSRTRGRGGPEQGGDVGPRGLQNEPHHVLDRILLGAEDGYRDHEDGVDLQRG